MKLGIEFTCNKRNQEIHINKYEMKHCNLVAVPMKIGNKLNKQKTMSEEIMKKCIDND